MSGCDGPVGPLKVLTFCPRTPGCVCMYVALAGCGAKITKLPSSNATATAAASTTPRRLESAPASLRLMVASTTSSSTTSSSKPVPKPPAAKRLFFVRSSAATSSDAAIIIKACHEAASSKEIVFRSSAATSNAATSAPQGALRLATVDGKLFALCWSFNEEKSVALPTAQRCCIASLFLPLSPCIHGSHHNGTRRYKEGKAKTLLLLALSLCHHLVYHNYTHMSIKHFFVPPYQATISVCFLHFHLGYCFLSVSESFLNERRCRRRESRNPFLTCILLAPSLSFAQLKYTHMSIKTIILFCPLSLVMVSSFCCTCLAFLAP